MTAWSPDDDIPMRQLTNNASPKELTVDGFNYRERYSSKTIITYVCKNMVGCSCKGRTRYSKKKGDYELVHPHSDKCKARVQPAGISTQESDQKATDFTELQRNMIESLSDDPTKKPGQIITDVITECGKKSTSYTGLSKRQVSFYHSVLLCFSVFSFSNKTIFPVISIFFPDERNGLHSKEKAPPR